MDGPRRLARRQAETLRGNETMAPRYAQAWERFLESGSVSNFYQAWDQWAAGRTPFYSFVIPVGPYQELTEPVRRVQLVLRNLPGVDVIPYQSLHITVQMVGFEGQGGGDEAKGLRRATGRLAPEVIVSWPGSATLRLPAMAGGVLTIASGSVHGGRSPPGVRAGHR